MAYLVGRCSVLKKALIAVFCTIAVVCVPPRPAAAQRRAVGGGAPVPAPPVRAYAPPMRTFAPPVSRAPIFVPRMPAVPVTSRLATANLQYRPRPIRPAPIIFIYSPTFFYNWPAWGFNTCWWATCDLFWGLGYDFLPAYSYGPAMYVSPPEYSAPVYVYGEERPEYPQLYLKDGTVYNVTDYWLIDDQLHFTMIEADVTKPAEQVIGFDQLDVQKTVNADTQRGFRFVLRNEPIDQYLRDHPDANPPAVPVPQK